jgi:biotin synthase
LLEKDNNEPNSQHPTPRNQQPATNNQQPTTMQLIRHDWTLAEIQELYDLPALDLVYKAASVHREYHDADEVQVCKLISIKTGGCPEDCKYCSQSAHYETEIDASPLMSTEEVLATAQRAKDAGLTRVCMGAAWREVKDNKQFDRVLEMVRGVNEIGVEVCCTLGMLTEEQAKKLEEAGLYAYNHNLDTSREYYSQVITTRTFDDRLKTIENVRKTNITVCSGGIMGLGETVADRLSMLQTLSSMTPHPESVPVNILSKVPGTPFEKNNEVPFWETLKMIAVARILMPKATIRLSAGRVKLSASEQALCFMAGADSFFSSEQKIMLTKAAGCPAYDEDKALLGQLGMKMRPPFKDDSRVKGMAVTV